MADYEVLSFRGISLSGNGRYGFLSASDSPLSRSGTPEMQRADGAHPTISRVLNTARPVNLHVQVEADDTRTEIEAILEHFPLGARGPMAVEVGGETRVLDVVVAGSAIYSLAPNVLTIRVIAANPLWRSEDPVIEDSILDAPGLVSLTNAGNATDLWPTVLLQSAKRRSSSDSWQYFADVVAVNRAPRDIPLWAVDLTAGGWDHAAEVSAGRSLASGDDVRVLVDGVEVPRWAPSSGSHVWNQSTTTIWVNLGFGPSLSVATAAAMQASTPMNGGALALTADSEVTLLPPSGSLLIDDEVIDYSGVVSRNDDGLPELQHVVRGVRGTTAATHSTGATVYLVEHRIQVMWGWLAAGAPAERPDLEPMLDLGQSTNTALLWTDFFDTAEPRRSMQWARARQTGLAVADGLLAPGASPTGALAWQYSADGPQIDAPEFNVWSLTFPTGLATGGTAVSGSVDIDSGLALVTSARDGDGNEVELDSQSGPVASGSLTVSGLSGPVYSVSVAARSQVVAAAPGTYGGVDDSIQTSYSATGNPAQQFTAPSAGELNAIEVDLANSNTADVTLALFAEGDDGGPDYAMQLTADVQLSLSAAGTYQFVLAAPLALESGERAWIAMKATNTGFAWRRQAVSATTGYRAWTNPSSGSGLVTGIRAYRAISRSMDIPASGAAPADGDEASVDEVTVYLAGGSALDVSGVGSRQDAYFMDTDLLNAATGQEFNVRYLAQPGDMLRVDVAGRAVYDLAGAPMALEVAGDVISDRIRALALEGDGLPVGSGTGVWGESENLVTNGGFETNTTGWSVEASGTMSRTTTDAKFGSAALDVGCPAATDGIRFSSITSGVGQGETLSISCWMKAKAAGDVGKTVTFFASPSGGTYEQTTGSHVLTSDWEQASLTFTWANSGHTSAALILRDNVGQGGFDFLLDGVQVEETSLPTPYIETDGSAESRAAASVDLFASGFLDDTQGWVALRCMTGWGAAQPPGGGSGYPCLVRWGTSDYLLLAYDEASGQLVVTLSTAGGSSSTSQSITLQEWSPFTAVVTWASDQIGISVNGAAPSTAAGAARSLTGTLSLLQGYFATWPLDGNCLALAAGTGRLTDADLARLDDLLARPGITLGSLRYELSSSALPVIAWNGLSDRIEVEGAAQGQLLPSSITPLSRGPWLSLPPGESELSVDETGLAGLRVVVTGHDRWQ